MSAKRFNEYEWAALARYGFKGLTVAETKAVLSLIYSIPHHKRADQDNLLSRVQLIMDLAATLLRSEIEAATQGCEQAFDMLDDAIRMLEALRAQMKPDATFRGHNDID